MGRRSVRVLATVQRGLPVIRTGERSANDHRGWSVLTRGDRDWGAVYRMAVTLHGVALVRAGVFVGEWNLDRSRGGRPVLEST